MSNNLKIASPWSQLALFLGLLGGSLILAGISIILIPGYHIDRPMTAGTLKFAQTISSIILFGIPAFLYARLTFRSHPLYELGFRKAPTGAFYLAAVLLLLFSYPLEGWLGILNQKIPLPQWMIKMEQDSDRQVENLLKMKSSADLYINLLVVAVIPAIFEEICFRGALQRIMIYLFRNHWVGIIVTGILFSAFHLQFEGFLPRMFLGILLGAAYWYSGSLWTSILAHACFNGVQVVLVSQDPKMINETPSVPWYLVVASLVLVVYLLVYMRKRSVLAVSSPIE
ncbi:MAG TPA: CPBP family intramembrane glutamic endopeptidase [Puia sp.]|nr:CPBP family intramembrane glutamic endopeptidase [Puia sp.]